MQENAVVHSKLDNNQDLTTKDTKRDESQILHQQGPKTPPVAQNNYPKVSNNFGKLVANNQKNKQPNTPPTQ